MQNSHGFKSNWEELSNSIMIMRLQTDIHLQTMPLLLSDLSTQKAVSEIVGSSIEVPANFKRQLASNMLPASTLYIFVQILSQIFQRDINDGCRCMRVEVGDNIALLLCEPMNGDRGETSMRSTALPRRDPAGNSAGSRGDIGDFNVLSSSRLLPSAEAPKKG